MNSKLITFDQLKAVAQRTNSEAAEVAAAAAEAIAEVDSVKADRGTAGSFTVPRTGWGSDSTADYPKYYDIPVTGLTNKDRAEVTILPASYSTVLACGLCPTNETLTGKIRIRAASVPSATIALEYWILDGKE